MVNQFSLQKMWTQLKTLFSDSHDDTDQSECAQYNGHGNILIISDRVPGYV